MGKPMNGFSSNYGFFIKASTTASISSTKIASIRRNYLAATTKFWIT